MRLFFDSNSTELESKLLEYGFNEINHNIYTEGQLYELNNVDSLLKIQILEDFNLKRGAKSNHSFELILKPGRNILKFETKEPSVKPGGGDNRKLAFSLGELVVGISVLE